MVATTPMQIGFASLLGWVVPAALILGGLGVWPTWRIAGQPAVHAMLVAAGTVLGVILCGSVVIVRAARGGPGRAAFTFIAIGFVQGVALLVVKGLWLTATDLPVVPTLLWAVLFYVAMLVAQSLWLARGLRRDAYRVALGDIERPAGF